MVERRSLISHVCIIWEGGAIRTPAGSVHDVISSYHPTGERLWLEHQRVRRGERLWLEHQRVRRGERLWLEHQLTAGKRAL